MIKCHVNESTGELDKQYIREHVCRELKSTYSIGGYHYCLLHVPIKAKIDQFKVELDQRIKQGRYNFRGAYFPAELFVSDKEFNAPVDFIDATFQGPVHFTHVKFHDLLDFNGATFHKEASFTWTTFAKYASFHAVTVDELAELVFSDCRFNGEVMLHYATIKGHLSLIGNKDNCLFHRSDSFLNLESIRVDNPVRVSFSAARLRPSWFVRANSTSYSFTDCAWTNTAGKFPRLAQELEDLAKREIDNPHAELIKSAWQLAENFENSKNFPDASKLRTLANEALNALIPSYKRPFHLHWWYRLSSFYGESWRRAALILLCLIVIFGLIYDSPFASFEQPKVETIGAVSGVDGEYRMINAEGLIYSLNVAALQHPEPKAHDTQTKTFVILEIILAPLQAALLALAIRRRFMR